MRRLALIVALCFACAKGAGDQPCAQTSDCPSPEQCVAGRCAGSGLCVGSPSCNDDRTCGAGQHCKNGCCAPGEAGSCARDADCSSHPETPVCDLARSACVACVVARDCGPGKLCQNDACVALPGCASNRDCVPPSPVCDLQHHACVQCLDQADCTNLSALNCDATHHCVASCASDASCAKPTPRCQVSSGSCVACLTSADCVTPQVCDPVQNVCLFPSATTCNKDQDCASNGAAPHCKPGSNGSPGTCVACLIDTQCAAGEICTAQNTCIQKQCLGDSDCAAPTPRCLVGATPQVCVACLANADCPNGGICQKDHTCVAATGCALCQPPTPACNTTTNTCVACVSPKDCAASETCTPQNTCVSTLCTSDNSCTSLPSTPHCDTVTGSCVQCVSDGQCPAGARCVSDHCKPVCTTATQAQDCPAATPVCRVSPYPACVQCVASTDCPAGQVCTSSNTCVVQTTGCTSNASCPASTPVCVAPNCVQCASDADCTNGEGCDTTAHTCTLTGGSGQICGPGNSCNAGLLCIKEGGPYGPVCRPSCNPYAAACASGTVCSWIGFDASGAFQGYCSAPNGHAQLGAACDPSLGSSCEWNLICAPTSFTAGVCRSMCDPSASGNCGGSVCNAVTGAVSAAFAQEQFGYCGPASQWGKPCVSDTGSLGPDCGAPLSGAGTGASLYCSPSYLPAESPQASVLGICSFTPAAATAIGGAGSSCAAHANNDCRTGVCLSDGPVTCFSGCNPSADCDRDGASTPPVYCFDLNFQTPYKSNRVASCEPTCRDDGDCAALGSGGLGRACLPQPTHNASSWRATCAPVSGGGTAGARCKGTTDCASGICVTAARLQQIELGQPVAGFTATDGFCLGSALSADCTWAGTPLSSTAALPLQPLNGDQGVMGAPHPGVCWPMGCSTNADCVGLSLDPATPRVCAPYKTTAIASTDSVSCTSTGCSLCNDATNNPNPGGVYGANAGIYGPNGKCREVSWALACAPSLGAARAGPGAACTYSTDCQTGHCLVPGTGGASYCFGGCASDGDCLSGTHCRFGSYLGMSVSFCQP